MLRKFAFALVFGSTIASLTTTAWALDIQVVKQVAPEYPRRARIANIEGHVDLRFEVTADGRATDIEVVDARPKRVFDYAAARALERWRFRSEDAEKSGTVRIEFSI